MKYQKILQNKGSLIKMFNFRNVYIIFSNHIYTPTCDLNSGETNPNRQKLIWILASLKCIQVLVYSWWEVVFNVPFHPETLRSDFEHFEFIAVGIYKKERAHAAF